MPRPKGSKKEKNQSSSSSSPVPSIQFYSNEDLNWIRTWKRCDYEESILPISSSSEINGGRVVVNPAVLRYLEQNRSPTTIHRNLSMDINEGREENSTESHLLTHERVSDTNDFIGNDRFWDFSAYSTEFLTSARLAEWILAYPLRVKHAFIN